MVAGRPHPCPLRAAPLWGSRGERGNGSWNATKKNAACPRDYVDGFEYTAYSSFGLSINANCFSTFNSIGVNGL